MKHKKHTYWIGLALAFALIAGLALPAAHANAAKKAKQKNEQKVLVVYFSATGTTKSAAKKIKKSDKRQTVPDQSGRSVHRRRFEL